MLQVVHMDCLAGLRMLPDNFADSIVTDPPYGLSFMGRKWDYDVPSEAIWRECLRVLKPGGHLLAFAGTRTQHRMAVRIEDAGFEIRDMIAWVYGSGFPKSLDVSKALDAAAGAVRTEVVGKSNRHNSHSRGSENSVGFQGGVPDLFAPATDAAREWQGWGTALKPALEPITVARKPLEGTVASNVLAHGVGGLNIDGCRVATTDAWAPSTRGANDSIGTFKTGVRTTEQHDAGRWPANLIHDGSDEVLGAFPQASEGESAARFFYCAKSSKSDRGEGNVHPTVKPTDLMRYLCRLVTPPGGLVLDPFTGSGSTGKAAALEGFKFLGFEREAEYVTIARARIGAAHGL